MTRPESPPSSVFAFRKHDNVGSAAAEDDVQFLDDCFLDTGDLRLLVDCGNPKRIVVGRTGTGKSALLYQLSREQAHVIQMSPHDLSLNFIATNRVIAFFEEAGVNLSPFYVLLWKHLLVVELLKKKYNIVNEGAHKDFMERIKEMVYRADRQKAQAVEYLQQWGNKFWLTTEQRVHELTNRVETSLSGGIDANIVGAELSVDAARRLSTEQKRQIVDHGLDAVSKVQIRELDNMIAVLAENVFEDQKDPYFVTIDMLDEDWADDRIRFKLIRALVDVVRRFKSVPNVKVVLALRQDLLDKVVYSDTVPGFQEEKYKSLYLNLHWSKKDLAAVVQKRISKLIRRRYTKGDVEFKDVFATKVDGHEPLEYMLERTFLRPRDIIVFLNECLELSEGRTSISAATIKAAEERYSAERLQSLANEWSTIWPNLAYATKLFYGLKERFEVSEITEQFLQERYADLCADVRDQQSDPITRSLCAYFTGGGNFAAVRNFVLREFYLTGLLGIKSGPTDSVSWCRLGGHSRLAAGDVRPSSTMFIHPMFHRALGVRLVYQSA